METNRGRQEPSTSLSPEGSRATSPISREELDAIDHDIGDAIKHSPKAWREAEALLKSVPCIGDVTVRTSSR